MKYQPSKIELDVRSIQSTMEALDYVRKTFEQAREADGYTKKEFADLIGRDPAYVSRILNGRVSNVNFQTLARMLIALGEWPTLSSRSLEEYSAPSNYCHADVVKDRFVRSTSTRNVCLEFGGTERTRRDSSAPTRVLQHG